MHERRQIRKGNAPKRTNEERRMNERGGRETKSTRRKQGKFEERKIPSSLQLELE